MKRYGFLFVGMLVLSLGGLSGCGPAWHVPAWWATWLDPSKVTAVTCQNDLTPILPQVDAVDEYQAVVPNAEPPKLEDLQWTAQEYVLGSGDVVDVSVLSLFTEGTEALLRRQVSNAGYIDLPLLPNRIYVNGLTVEQARQAIVKAYAPNILKEATVSISLEAPRQNIFSILGSVQRPGTYPIVRSEFRLLEALALAGDQTEKEIEYVYVIRLNPEARTLGPAAATQAGEQQAAPANLPAIPGTTGPAAAPTQATAPSAEETMRELQRFMPGAAPQGAAPGAEAAPGTAASGEALPSVPPGGAEPAVPGPSQPGPQGMAAPQTPAQPSSDSNEQALKELQQFMPNGAAQPETGAAKPVVLHLTDTGDGNNSTEDSASGFTWTYENGQWVRVHKPGSAPSTAPGESTPSAETSMAAQEASARAAEPATSPMSMEASNPATSASGTQATSSEILEGKGHMAAAPTAPPESPAAAPANSAIPIQPEGAPVRKPWLPPSLSNASNPTTDPFGWATADLSSLARVIAIDLRKLKDGDPRQNIIIRDNDVVMVPSLPVGEFYVLGEVARPGVYNITGRKVTLKQAIAAAGDLGVLAWPSNSVLIRRIGDNQELRIPLHLDLIMEGKEPDVLLKPDDLIAVGTHISAPFLAVIRNAFRLTYGFGFIYDRNYSEANIIPGTAKPFNDFFDD